MISPQNGIEKDPVTGCRIEYFQFEVTYNNNLVQLDMYLLAHSHGFF